MANISTPEQPLACVNDMAIPIVCDSTGWSYWAHLGKFKWRYIREGSPIYSVFGSRVGFAGSADRMALFPV